MNAMKKMTPSAKQLLAGIIVMTVSLCAGADLLVPNACVIVYDATKPIISPIGTLSLTIAVGAAYADPGATATDNMDGDVTARIAVVSNVNPALPGQYTVTYNVTDGAGNSAVPVTRTVIVYQPDITKPVIVLSGNPSVTIEVLGNYVDAGATATDNVDGNITAKIVTVNTVNTAKLGAYTVTYNVSDAAGNAADPVVRNVKVVDTTPPVITIKQPA